MKLFIRLYQLIFQYASVFIRWKEPLVFQSTNALSKAMKYLAQQSQVKWCVITDPGIKASGLLSTLTKELDRFDMDYVVFEEVVPNPTIRMIDQATQLYLATNCTGLIALGGGSSIDAAKGVALRIAKPTKTFQQLRGLLKVWAKLPPVVAIPTTAGTGSEVTIAAVISDDVQHQKFAVIDPHLIPAVAVLDPQLIINLPPHITSTTGMDALTHAIEAYIGFGPRYEKAKAVEAVLLIHQHLVASYENPHVIEHREAMLRASYLAGQAFTRDYVGNVHAMAHALGAFYHIPHGYANAVILPHVLRYYGSSIHARLARLYFALYPNEARLSIQEAATRMIEWIESINQEMTIPTHITCPDSLHLDAMIQHALKEANPTYPVPVIFQARDFKLLFNQVMMIVD